MTRHPPQRRASSKLASAQANRADAHVHQWTRLSSVKWEDSWTERLRFLGLENLVFVTWENSRALKIQVYCSRRQAQALVGSFGGRCTKLPAHVANGTFAPARGPLSIRGKLKIFSNQLSWRRWKKRPARPDGIFIPAGLAFGTGEHATTATCLRLLADTTGSLPANFTALDLGTGTGILAVAARALGASRVEAIDYDPTAVRIARQNAAANGFQSLRVQRGNVLKLAVRFPFDLVLANLLSDILVKATPRIAKAIRPGGWLIFSGVLRNQVMEVATAFKATGFSNPRLVIRGKWCAGVCQRGPE